MDRRIAPQSRVTNHAAIAAELQRRQESGEFKPINRPQHQPETTTTRMVAMEKENIQTMLDGKESRPAVVEAERVKELVTTIAERQQRRLNAKQQSAIEQILSSRDQIIGLQGGAGTGKTTALSVLREAAPKRRLSGARGCTLRTRCTAACRKRH